MLIEAFEEIIMPSFPNARLIIGGGNNHNAGNYIEGLQEKQVGHDPRQRHRGIVLTLVMADG